MGWLVIEKHGGIENAAIVTNEDGTNKVFDTEEEANAEALECQDGVYLEID